jgi:hypothetical protein
LPVALLPEHELAYRVGDRSTEIGETVVNNPTKVLCLSQPST